MASNEDLVFYHSPHSRSGGVLVLLEELGAGYTLHLLNMRTGEQRKPEYLAVNPMGKVPAIVHKGALVTEQTAVYLYLADLFPGAGITPGIGDALRGPFLRWLAFYGSCFEPALVDKSQGHTPPRSTSPYGDYDTTLKTLTDQLERGPYILGDRFTVADVLWATALTWTTMFKLVPESAVVKAYIDRVNARPAFARASEKEAELLASQG